MSDRYRLLLLAVSSLCSCGKARGILKKKKKYRNEFEMRNKGYTFYNFVENRGWGYQGHTVSRAKVVKIGDQSLTCKMHKIKVGPL